MAGAEQTPCGGALKRARENALPDSDSDAELREACWTIKAQEDFEKMATEAKDWKCRTCKRSDVTPDVRQDKQLCTLCLEIGLLARLPQKPELSGELRTRCCIFVAKTNAM
eukprot:857676-Alexandrium_andersonii.AAC.1